MSEGRQQYQQLLENGVKAFQAFYKTKIDPEIAKNALPVVIGDKIFADYLHAKTPVMDSFLSFYLRPGADCSNPEGYAIDATLHARNIATNLLLRASEEGSREIDRDARRRYEAYYSEIAQRLDHNDGHQYTKDAMQSVTNTVRSVQKIQNDSKESEKITRDLLERMKKGELRQR